MNIQINNVLLIGDITCDFSRPTHFVQSIRTFAEEKGLNIFWNLPDNDRIEEVSYTYRNTVNNITSTPLLIISSVMNDFIVQLPKLV